MSEPHVSRYGSWKSPITSDVIVDGTIGLGGACQDGSDIYWTEMRPTEGGRTVLVRYSAEGEVTEMTPLPFNVRTRVHEYGGGSAIVQDGVIYFSNYVDQRLYRQVVGQAPIALTPEVAWRYADSVLDTNRQRLLCVREDHTGAGEPINTIVAVPLDAGEQQILVAGSDFYSSPRLSPDGTKLAWIGWQHPHMPWDATELWVADIAADGTLSQAQKIAGHDQESVVEPQWSPDGQLYFISDRSNWWNLYRWSANANLVEAICPMEAEFGSPHWVFGASHYGFRSKDILVCTYSQQGISYLAQIDLATQALTPIPVPYTEIASLDVTPDRAVFYAGSALEPGAIVRMDFESHQLDVLKRASALTIDPGYLSEPQAIAFPTDHGLTAYGFFYPPKNKDFVAPDHDLPPLLVKSHGGPTAATSTAFNLKIQYWTSRGFAVLDVNYGGSTGYGREYRERLKGQWGIVDVADCANGASYLAQSKLVDGNRLVINGGSAGGYTTLCALTFRDTFKAGASYYGVSDLEALATDTHKFESRYLDSLIGPYPERRDLYQARSPIYACDQLSCPVIFFQGDEDRIVPPNQAERMVDVLRAKKLPVAYVLFEGEQHGFRKAENIKRTLDGEFYFYSKVFGFEIADPVEPVEIENLSTLAMQSH